MLKSAVVLYSKSKHRRRRDKRYQVPGIINTLNTEKNPVYSSTAAADRQLRYVCATHSCQLLCSAIAGCTAPLWGGGRLGGV